jgi:long-chain fatty acid transport protein
VKTSLVALGAMLGATGAVHAGGIDRSTQSAMILFEQGNYAEFTIGTLAPDVSGQEISPLLGNQSSGSMATDYTLFNGGVKFNMPNGFSGAVILDKPFGADVDYPLDTDYFAEGSTATLDTGSITGLLRYTTPDQISVFGGVRYQTLSADALIPFVTAGRGVPYPGAPYEASGDESGEFGYVLGVGWEKPEIAAKVALTYNSAIDYEMATSESSAIGSLDSTTPVTTPQSVNLDFQTGVAPGWLVFGSIRWVDWEQFEIAPEMYAKLTGGAALVSYNGPTTTSTIGVGHQFNETWSGAVTYTYDTPLSGYQSNLNPINGYNAVGLSATYTSGPFKVTAAARYYALGDAQTAVGPIAPATNFDDNDAMAFVLRVGYSF